MDFDDRFSLELLWRKDCKEPFRARLSFASPGFNERSIELPAGTVIAKIGEALQDADRLCVQEFACSLAQLFQRYASRGSSPARHSLNPSEKVDSA
ncbi:MAG: hypothetical protein AB7O68_16710 [Pirellulales bacterium]